MKIRSIIAVGMTACGMIAAAPSFAGNVTSTIVAVYARQNDGLVYFDTKGPITNRAACAQSNNTWALPNENTEIAKKQYAAILMAKASNLPVDVWGTGACTRFNGVEDLNVIVVHD